jgi:asparagine synthetase B (glutamine-hydrolysing)
MSRTLLPTGRNNGLSNMLGVLQSAIKDLTNAQVAGLPTTDSQQSLSTGSLVTASENQDATKISNAPAETLEDAIKRGVWGIDTSDEVAVLLSGGVDSSVSLKLCQEQGLKVRAFYLKIWLEDGEDIL